MLLRRETLDKIASGEVDLAFRRWRRPTVKAGGTRRTALGMLRIVAVDGVELDDITEEEATRAGSSLPELRSWLQDREGRLYRIGFGGFEEDPRESLRADDELSHDDLAALLTDLDRLDGRSGHGPWTRDVLRLIEDRPHVRAQDLADEMGLEKAVFKADVARLKALGLTISHSPGYSLSPRGRALVASL